MKQRTTSVLLGSPLPPDPEKVPLRPGEHLSRRSAASIEGGDRPYVKHAKEVAKFSALGLVVYALGYWQWSFLGVMIAILAGLMYRQRKEEKRAKV